MAQRNKAIDQLTEVPLELFEKLLSAGRQARERGQHQAKFGRRRLSNFDDRLMRRSRSKTSSVREHVDTPKQTAALATGATTGLQASRLGELKLRARQRQVARSSGKARCASACVSRGMRDSSVPAGSAFRAVTSLRQRCASSLPDKPLR